MTKVPILRDLFRLLDTKAKFRDLESYLEYVEFKKAFKQDVRLNEFFLKYNAPVGENPFHEVISPHDKEF